MAIYRFESFEDAARALWNFNPDSEYYRQVSQLFDMAFRLAPLKNVPGVSKYKSIYETERESFLEEIKIKIIESLKPVDPYMVKLFGSYAWGQPSEDSDIDLYVVTKDEFIPRNYDENMEVYLHVARCLRDFKKQYATDLIVHTKYMHEKFIDSNSSFSRKIMKDGLSIL